MKNQPFNLCVAVLLLVSFSTDIYSQSNVSAIFGSSINESGFNPSLGLIYQQQIGKGFSIESGLGYSSFDRESSNNHLTYNWQSYSAFFGFVYTTEISNKIRIVPFLDFGYGSFNYTLNEFESPSRSKGAFSLYPGTSIVIGLNEKISLMVRNRVVIHFIEFKKQDDITLPTNIITVNEKQQSLFDICIGLVYYLN